VKIFTIGFTKRSAKSFFEALRNHGVKRLIDVRLNNVSQLAGFTKREDLRYFARAVGDIDYIHLTQLAPTQELLDAYKKKRGEWSDYEREFLQLMSQRQIESTLDKNLFADACLLCSEPTAKKCHRRLVAEYLSAKWGDVQIQHL
jgi:uncharacterized protein (DUF488 family)